MATKIQIIYHRVLGVVPNIICGFLKGFRSASPPCLQKKGDKEYAVTHLHVIQCTLDHSCNTTGQTSTRGARPVSRSSIVLQIFTHQQSGVYIRHCMCTPPHELLHTTSATHNTLMYVRTTHPPNTPVGTHN